MYEDRITAIRVKGLRSLADVTLDLTDLTVLIGANGAGKSSLVEACELLRKIGTEVGFLNESLGSAHGGAAALLRRGYAPSLELEVELEGDEGRLRYGVVLLNQSPYLRLQSERLEVDVNGTFRPLMVRSGPTYSFFEPRDREDVLLAPGARPIANDLLALLGAGNQDHAPGIELSRMRGALGAIEVHTPFDVRPRWVAPEELGARSANVVQGARRLAVGGKNLSNVLLHVRNQRNFPRVLDEIRLGLGDEFEDLVVRPMPSGGQIAIEVRLRGGWELPIFSLSDGQVAYLAHVAIAHMERASLPSLVVLDEPELHFHPGLVVRLAQMLERAAERFPVLVATQSDTFLDALSAPEESTVLCELDADRATRLSRPDPDTLKAWLADYEGLGALRRSGFDRLVFHEVDRHPAEHS